MLRSRFSAGRTIQFLIVLVLLPMGIACGQRTVSPDVVATTKWGVIHRADLDAFILDQPQNRRRPPDGQSLTEWRRRVLEDFIGARALEEEAVALNLLDTDEGRRLMAETVDSVLVETRKARLMQGRVAVTEEDLREFYETNPDEFSHAEQIRLRNLYRRVPRDAPEEVWEEARQEMEGWLSDIRRGARFEDLARMHSDSETARLDGLIGRLDHGQLDPKLERVLWSMNEGEVSEVIRTPVGFQLFKVENFLGHSMVDFEEARTRIHRRLTRVATEKAEAAILRELLEESGAEYEPDLIRGGKADAVIFSLGEDRMTVGDVLVRLDAIGFFASHDRPLREQIDAAVRDRLILWKAVDIGLENEPGVAERFEGARREALKALALRQRSRQWIEQLDESEIRDYYRANQERFQSPRLFHLRILTREFGSDRNWYDVYEELEALAADIRDGKRNFADAARTLSADFTARRGGDVGAIRLEAFTQWAGPQAQHKVLALSEGEVSEPILIERFNTNRLTYDREGYMLVRLESIQDAGPQPFDEVRDQVVELFLQSRSAEVEASLRADILRSVDAEIYEDNL